MATYVLHNYKTKFIYANRTYTFVPCVCVYVYIGIKHLKSWLWQIVYNPYKCN